MYTQASAERYKLNLESLLQYEYKPCLLLLSKLALYLSSEQHGTK